jgi:uncharacterized phiE125 gp8 family phage protein
MTDRANYSSLTGALPYGDRTRYPGQEIHSQLVLKTGPAVEPVSLPIVKKWLIVESNDDDELLTTLITEARETVEGWLERALVTQTWTLWLDALPFEIELRKPPIQTVNSIKYIDVNDGSLQTVDPSVYQVDIQTEPGRVRPAYLQIWPIYRSIPNCIQVEFVAGYGDDGSAVPATIRQAITRLVAVRYRNREVMTIGPSEAENEIKNKVRRFGWGCF